MFTYDELANMDQRDFRAIEDEARLAYLLQYMDAIETARIAQCSDHTQYTKIVTPLRTEITRLQRFKTKQDIYDETWNSLQAISKSGAR